MRRAMYQQPAAIVRARLAAVLQDLKEGVELAGALPEMMDRVFADDAREAMLRDARDLARRAKDDLAAAAMIVDAMVVDEPSAGSSPSRRAA